MNRCQPQPGTPVEELDTPSLLIDLDSLEHNFRIVADTYGDSVCKMREHTKNIKSPDIARMQIEIGGTLNGVCTAKLAEAEVMISGGITDILIANQIVTRDKIARLCTLSKRGDVKVCVDDLRNVRDLSDVAQIHGATIGVLIEVDTSMGRAGIRRIEQGVELAKLAVSLPGVVFRGLMSHQHLEEYTDDKTRVLVARENIQKTLDVKAAIEAEHIPVEMVSSGETFSYDVAPRMLGVTDVEGGTYALMCTRYRYMPEFEIANKVLCTVIRVPCPGVVVGDVGTRAMSLPGGEMPEVENMPGVKVETMQEENVVLRIDDDRSLNVGDKFLLLPWYQDMMVNRWDQFIAIRDGVVEDVWEISGRGCSQ